MDIYVLIFKAGSGLSLKGSQIICIADDFERCSVEMAKYTAAEQAQMAIENHDLLSGSD